MTPAEARKLAEVWERLEDANSFARTYTSICRAMDGANDPEQYALGVQALTRGLADQHRDLVEMIVETGRALPEVLRSEPVSADRADPLDFLAGVLDDGPGDAD